MSYTVHPAADAFPMMSDAELEELAADIAANGLRHPLVFTHDGAMLIDGRNRLRACQIAGVEIADERLPEDWTDAQIIDFIVSANVKRRHLTPSQKAMVASALEPMYAEAARERMLAGKADPRANSPQGSTEQNKSREQAAKAVGASGRSVSDAKALKRDAPDLADKVVNGDMTLNAATVERKKRQGTPDDLDADHEEPAPSKGQPTVDPGARMRPKKPNPFTCDVDTWDDSYTRISHGIEALLRNPTHAQAAKIEKLLGRALAKVDTGKGATAAATLAQVADGEVVVAYSSLPGTAKQKVDSIARWIVKDCEADLEDIRQDIEAEHAERIGADVQSFLDERIKNLEAREAKADAIIQAHKGKAPLTEKDYELISNLLHQDTRLSASDEKLHRARLLFNTDQVKALLVAADDDRKTPTPRKKPLPSHLPPSARRVKEAQEREKRRAARAARRARFYES